MSVLIKGVCVQRREGGRGAQEGGGERAQFWVPFFSPSETTQYGQLCFKVLDLGNCPQ